MMENRFLIFIVAVLLGVKSSQAFSKIKLDGPAATPSLQSNFVFNSKQLEMSWDKETIIDNYASCLVYVNLTLFNLQPIRGPYYVELDLDNDSNGVKEKLEVHFCNPVLQYSSVNKRSLVFVRKTDTDDVLLKRAVRLTSGDNSFSSKNILRE
jgi:hypothetical protein